MFKNCFHTCHNLSCHSKNDCINQHLIKLLAEYEVDTHSVLHVYFPFMFMQFKYFLAFEQYMIFMECVNDERVGGRSFQSVIVEGKKLLMLEVVFTWGT